MYSDEEMVKEAVEQMNSGEISVSEAWSVFDNFDGDIFDYLQVVPFGGRTIFIYLFCHIILITIGLTFSQIYETIEYRMKVGIHAVI